MARTAAEMPKPEFPLAHPSSMHKLLCLLLLISLFVPALAQDEKPYRVGDGVTAPKLTYKVEPKYTQEARDAGIEGTVILSVVISKEGTPEEIKIKKPLFQGLDENAVKAFQQWKFEPGTKDGKPVRVTATVEINFRLN